RSIAGGTFRRSRVGHDSARGTRTIGAGAPGMSPEIIRRDEARRDLLDTYVYIGRQNPAVAERFLDAVEETLSQLLQMPGLGRPRNFSNAALTGMRSHRVKDFDKYLVFYRPVETGIEVVRVLHGARDLQTLFDEME